MIEQILFWAVLAGGLLTLRMIWGRPRSQQELRPAEPDVVARLLASEQPLTREAARAWLDDFLVRSQRDRQV